MFEIDKLHEGAYTNAELTSFLQSPKTSESDKVEIAKALKPKKDTLDTAPKKAAVVFFVHDCIKGDDDKQHVSIEGYHESGNYNGNISVTKDQDDASDLNFNDYKGKHVVINCEITVVGVTQYKDSTGKPIFHKSSGLRPSSFIAREASAMEAKRFERFAASSMELSLKIQAQGSMLSSRVKSVMALTEDEKAALKDFGFNPFA